MVLLVLLGGAGAAPRLAAQQDTIRWWDGAAALGGAALASAFDEAVQHATQEHRTRFGDEAAAVARRMGQPEVFVTVPGAVFLAGIVAGRPALRRSGERIAGSLALAGVLVTGAKLVIGRLRPFQSEEPYDLKPFSGADAFPSGHATMAFGLAAALADEIRRPWASVVLFAAAAGTGWSRLNDNKHWLSDVVAGAALGTSSAQLIEGRWTVLHFRPPAFLVAGGRPGIGWRVPFRLRWPARDLTGGG
ncbi:MAG TPA: phosphatase PAP2 family protein [Gemmatimonadales bacterium]|nr:phosphatase PAP2 family protein [Gemmatimonadales bacterium]